MEEHSNGLSDKEFQEKMKDWNVEAQDAKN